MINVSKGWNESQKNLMLFLKNQKTFAKGINLLLEMHSLLHDKKVYKTSTETFYDNLWEDMKDETCKIISDKETSTLWDIWHITRIEDIVSNIIIGNKETIFNNEIRAKLNIKIKQNGGVIDDQKSIWLLDFWGKKNILGLIMMPITKHQIVHLNDCFKIKQRKR